ncbi:MAG: cupin domain-containing protein [Anaerolineales bacterium]|nr:MAG: cupin domain-containing protein [Anaerolineales bacterium]
MIEAGFVAENPQAGVRAVVLKAHKETQGNGFQIEYFYRPHSGQDLPAHFHTWWEEKFEILAGSCTYVLEGKEYSAKAGDTVTLPARKSHIHPWNTGDEELHMIQTDTFEHSSPEAVIDTLNTIATQYGLVRDGKVGSDGQPTPLQLAVSMQTLLKHGGYLAGLPPLVQTVLFGLLGRIGHALGYRASYAEYLVSAKS